MKLYSAGQPVKELYAENARMYPLAVGGKTFTGREEIQAFWDGSKF